MSAVLISLSVRTKSDSAWPAAFGTISDFVLQHSEDFGYVSLSSTDMDDVMNAPEDEIQEIFTEETMDKVYAALKTIAHSEDEVTSIVTTLQNAGILFRERMS